jgi:hypothetical protein
MKENEKHSGTNAGPVIGMKLKSCDINVTTEDLLAASKSFVKLKDKNGYDSTIC